MADQTLLRQMNYSDLEALVAVEQASFSIPWTRGMLEEEFFNTRARYRVLEYEGCIVAYLGMWHILDEGHITNVAVHPNYRGKGFAKTLMRDLISHAKSSDILYLTLEVRVSNTPAIRLYESFGFRVEGRRKHYYADNSEDALIMWLKL